MIISLNTLTLSLFWEYSTLEEYLEQRELLQKPLEQERLLKETPKIIEDLVEIKKQAIASSDSNKQGTTSGLTQETVIDID
ncbi:unnamed protein product [Cochlearia groenlandica]